MTTVPRIKSRPSAIFAARVLVVGLFSLLTSTHLQAALTHLYDLNGSYADAFGGPSLVPNGGSLNATNYTFAANQGLSLSSGLSNSATYSLLLDFSFSDLAGFRKIVDFKDRTSDTGLYNLNAALNFYNVITGPAGAFVPDVVERLVITRDASNTFTGYVNGVQQISFTDSGSLAIFSGLNSIIHFFRDDTATGGEASAGLVDRIAVYDTPLTAAEVRVLGVPGEISGPTPRVPDGGSALCLFGGALGAIGFLRHKFPL